MIFEKNSNYWHKPDGKNQQFSNYSNAFDQRMSVAILRLPNGIDYSHIIPEFCMDSSAGALSPSNSTGNLAVYNTGGLTVGNTPPIIRPKLLHADSNLNIASMDHSSNPNLTVTSVSSHISRKVFVFLACWCDLSHVLLTISALEQRKLDMIRTQQHNKIVYSTRGGSTVPKELLETLGVFNKKQKKGTIDVWWLYDDGGE
jgi:solute carrier family 12 (sodium/potassium/chloride transporter), member 2